MASLFISYSRKDVEIARKLTESFNGQELDFWIDWEGIPPTVDWWKEIEKGIEEADNFLFLISPDSVGSKICKKEIEHAAKNGKRLIPVVVREVKADESPAELRPLNWIFLRENDDFNKGFSKVITAIKTDYEWVQAHRQLLVKALEWERNNKEDGFLLHGKELQDAEIQLATNTSKEPRPTDLQREYVLKSRQVTDKTRNRTIGGLAGFSILVLGLLIFSLIQLNSSRAQQLALQAQVAFTEQRYADAGLYAYQSGQIHANDEAENVLGKLVFENFATGRPLTGHKDAVRSVAWSADGHLASASDDGNIIIWDLSTGKPDQIIPSNGPKDLAWSADGRLAFSSVDGIIIWDLSTGKQDQVLNAGTSTGSIAWSFDGRLASSFADEIIIWDLSTGEPAQTLNHGTEGFGSLTWSADGRLSSITSDDSIIIWDLSTGEPSQILKAGSRPDSMAWSADGRLASAQADTIIVWDVLTGKKDQVLQRKTKSLSTALNTTSYFESVAWSADGQLLASASDDGTVIIWNLSTAEPAQTFRGYTRACRLATQSGCGTDHAFNVAWSADGHLASTSEDGTITVWTLISDRPAQTLNRFLEAVYIASSTLNEVYIASWSVDGRLASVSEDSIIIWDVSTGEPEQILKGHKDAVNSVAWSADGRLASASDGQIIIWDLSTSKPAQAFTEKLERVYNLAWSPDGRLAFSNFRFIEIWDPSNGKHTRIPDEHLGSWVDDVAWLPDGRLASTSDGQTIIWDLSTNQSTKIWTGTSQLEGRNVVAWSFDGRLASASANGVVTIWDLSTGKPAFTLRGETTFITSLAWSSDSRLASGSDDGAIIIWDISTGKPIRVLRPFESAVASLFWSPDGRLTVGSLDGYLKIARSDLLEESPCNWIYRNMTIQEWLDYQGPLYLYRPACPNLPVPPLDTTELSSISTWIEEPQLRGALTITWKGRIILLVIAIVFLAILAGVLWWSYQFISSPFRKIYERLRKKPATT